MIFSVDIQGLKNMICNFVDPPYLSHSTTARSKFPLYQHLTCYFRNHWLDFHDICCGYSWSADLSPRASTGSLKFPHVYKTKWVYYLEIYRAHFPEDELFPIWRLTQTFLWHHPQVKHTTFVEHIQDLGWNKQI